MIKYSSSLINVYNTCPFRFYCKIKDYTKSEDLESKYGDSGSVVHFALEYYFKNLRDLDLNSAMNELKQQFLLAWDSYELDKTDMDKNEYWKCVINGLKLNINPTDLEYEFKFETKEYKFVGYADVANLKEHWIGDWKTSTYKKSKVKGYREQLLYYAMCYYHDFKVIPKCWVYFNKVDKKFDFNFTLEEIQKTWDNIKKLNTEVLEKLKTNNFERTKKGCFFCPYKMQCSSDILRKDIAPKHKVILHLFKNKLAIESSMPSELHDKCEAAINYRIKNAKFVIQAMRAKGIRFDGIKRLYKRRPFGAETFIGFKNLIIDLFKGHFGDLEIIIDERRNKKVLDFKINIPKALNVPYDIYNYQLEAVNKLIKNKWGIIEIGTGGGKTLIAAEAIRQVGLRTLFVIDNKDLLYQTKKEYEEMLGLKCGIVGMGKREWKYPIVLSTIQTLNKNLKDFAKQLETFPVAVMDECHVIASQSYEKLSKYLGNTFYRFGFSATARRDDGNDNIIYGHTGTIVYKKNAEDLIKENVLVPPECIFYQYQKEDDFYFTENWQDEYAQGIVENQERNEAIKKIAKSHSADGQQVMILTKWIKHGEWFRDNIEGAELIYGKTADDIRVKTLEKFRNNELKILIGNLKIFNKGINIKNLDVLINASGNAGDVLTVQSIGRALRKNPGKKKAYYIDFYDNGNYCKKHSKSRINSLENENYIIKKLRLE